jgi:hypothetical protein
MYVMFPIKIFSYEDKESFVDNFDVFLVYFILGKLSNFHDRNKVFVNVDMLEAMLSLDSTNRQRSKRKIVEALEVMKSLGYIMIDSKGQEIMKAPILEVELVENFESSKSNRTIYSGFVKVDETLFDLANGDGKLLKILIYTKWRENIDYAISLEEWSNVLDISVATVKRLMNGYEKQGKLIVVHGEFYQDNKGRTRQRMNKYKIPSQTIQRHEVEIVTNEKHEADQLEEGIEINGQTLIF